MGLRGGWRDYCIVNAPERSGLGAFVVLLALVSVLAFVVAKRWTVRCGTSGSSQRDRPGLRGAWRAGCAADVRIGEACSTARSGGAVERQGRLEL